MNLQKELEDVLGVLFALQKDLEKMVRGDTEWPQQGDEYWTYSSLGNVVRWNWQGCEPDKARKTNHMCFRTREDAKLSMQQGLAYRMLWELADGGKWVIVNYTGIYQCSQRAENYDVPTFSTKEKTQAAIDEIGEELLDTIFEPGEK